MQLCLIFWNERLHYFCHLYLEKYVFYIRNNIKLIEPLRSNKHRFSFEFPREKPESLKNSKFSKVVIPETKEEEIKQHMKIQNENSIFVSIKQSL